MTTRQQRALYFPAWTAAARVLIAPRRDFHGNPLVNDLYQRIQQIASERLAARSTSAPSVSSAVKLDALRHACHSVAFGKDKSSADLTNAELDRILALFRLLADPDDLGAMLAWHNPAEEKRKRILWWLRHHCIESYVVAVSREKFGTDNWEALNPEDLRQLHMTLKNRPAAQKTQPPRPALAGRGQGEGFINLNTYDPDPTETNDPF